MRMTMEGVNPPQRKTMGSCGYDICCPGPVTITRGEWTDLDLGIMMDPGDIPEGCCGIIVPRSSMGVKYGLCLANTEGWIDSDYTMATIKASLTVTKVDKLELNINDRILQMGIFPFRTIPNEIPPTDVRKGGIGSTGVIG